MREIERLSLLLSKTNLYSRTWRITMREPAPSSSSYMRPRWLSSSRNSFQSIRSGHAIVLYHRGLTMNAELLDGGLGVWRGCTGEHSPRVTGPTGYASSAICIRSIGLENRSTGRPSSTAIPENRRSCGLPSTTFLAAGRVAEDSRLRHLFQLMFSWRNSQPRSRPSVRQPLQRRRRIIRLQATVSLPYVRSLVLSCECLS